MMRPLLAVRAEANRYEGGLMWYVGGGLLVLYIVLLVTLGIMTIRKGHWVMFIVGIFLPIVWIIGAVMPPRQR